MGIFVSESIVIKNESTSGANTANRVGSLFENLARDTAIVDTITDLKTYTASKAGDIIGVRGFGSPDDGGGGYFRRKETGELVSENGEPGDGSTSFASFTTQEYPLEFINGTNRPWLYRGSTTIYWASGAVWIPANYEPPRSTQGDFIHDDSIPVANGEKGFAIPDPNYEGWRVVPSHSGYSNEYYWERIVPGNEVTPEMYGASQSKYIGEPNPPDCTMAIQACMDSHFSVRFNPGSYYISGSTIECSFAKAVRGTGYNMVRNADDRPQRFMTKGNSNIWTDANFRMFNIRCEMDWYHINFDLENVGTFSTITGEVIDTGDGTTTTFTGSLSNPLEDGTLTITDTVESFSDQYDGTLSGSQGGSGSIDYRTGEYDITFATAPSSSQNITADYTGITSPMFTEEVINLDMSYPIYGGELAYLDFHGNPAIDRVTGVGGTAIRYNSDDADNTYTKPNGQGNVEGAVFFHKVYRCEAGAFYHGHKVDPLQLGQNTSSVTGNTIDTSVNANHVDMTFGGCKQPIRWEAGSINRISGEYYQDGGILTYQERDLSAFYMKGVSETVFDLGTGDNRQDTPSADDDPTIYPQAHYKPYLHEHDGGVILIGRARRNLDADDDKEKNGTPWALNTTPLIKADNMSGLNVFKKAQGGQKIKSFLDNQFWYADSKFLVTIDALEGDGFDPQANLTPQSSSLTTATEINIQDGDSIFLPTGLRPEITFNAGANETDDFVEIVVDFSNLGAVQPFYAFETFFIGTIGFRAIQCVYLDGNNNPLEDWYTETSSSIGTDTTMKIGRPGGSNNNIDKVLVRLIGGVIGGQTTFIDTIAHFTRTAYMQEPFVGRGGGEFYGGVTATDLHANNGFTGTYTNGDSQTVTVTDGIITDVT